MEDLSDSEAARAANQLADDVPLSDYLHDALGSAITEALYMSEETELGDTKTLTPEQEGTITRAAVAGALSRLQEMDADEFDTPS